MTIYAISATLGSLTDDRPPIGAVPPPGVAEPYLRLRRTVFDRPRFVPAVWDVAGDYPASHPYVRRYWTAILGPGAVADLLRLATAAQRGRSLPRPIHLVELARMGFVRDTGERILVRTSIPALPRPLHRRLPPALRRELDPPPGNPGGSGSGR
ncbi:MAG: hypothetical protein ACR2JP_00835 [Acidimicrobiia bacterium]